MSIGIKEALSLVGPGWASLIREYYKQKTKRVRVFEIKEKFGRLRIYDAGGDKAWYEFVASLEAESGRVCEFCGKAGTVRSLNGWYKSICQTCYNERSKNEEK